MEIKDFCKEKGLNFDNLDNEFCIAEIEDNYARKIADKIIERVEKYRKFIEEFLHADGSNVAVLMEIKGLDDKQKELMNDMYKKLMLLEREYMIIELSDNQFLEYIKTSLDKWNEIKTNLKDLVKKAKDSWHKKSDVREELGYLG